MATYLVIGASSGIGKATCTQLIEQGHEVYGTFNQTQEGLHPQVNWAYWNSNDPFEIDLPNVLDGVVYCPGTIDLKPFRKLNSIDLAADLSIHVFGAVQVLQSVYSRLKKSAHPAVVLFSSVAARVGFNYHTQVSMCKGAIEGLTVSLAAEWSPHIRVNAVAPSLTQTPLAEKLLSTPEKIAVNAKRHPLNTLGEAEDLAHLVTFLLTEKSRWMTGQLLGIDGGISTLRV